MANPKNLWQSFLARPNNDKGKVFGIAMLLALASSIAISLATVTLHPIQQANLDAEREARMAAMMDTLPGMRTLLEEANVDGLDVRLVDLSSGSLDTTEALENYDYDAALSAPDTSVDIPPEMDIAGLKKRPAKVPVYLLQKDGDVLLLALPVKGRGYQSTISAMLVLQADLATVAALTILKQDETPGLGARIDDEAWQALWPGKKVADDSGKIMISLVKGAATSPYEVDGISGATITSNGIVNMLRYWLGEHGFGPFIDQLKNDGVLE